VDRQKRHVGEIEEQLRDLSGKVINNAELAYGEIR
jgi:hypothetical protein